MARSARQGQIAPSCPISGLGTAMSVRVAVSNRSDRGRTAGTSFGKRNRERTAVVELSWNQQEVSEFPSRTKAPHNPSPKLLQPILS